MSPRAHTNSLVAAICVIVLIFLGLLEYGRVTSSQKQISEPSLSGWAYSLSHGPAENCSDGFTIIISTGDDDKPRQLDCLHQFKLEVYRSSKIKAQVVPGAKKVTISLETDSTITESIITETTDYFARLVTGQSHITLSGQIDSQ